MKYFFWFSTMLICLSINLYSQITFGVKEPCQGACEEQWIGPNAHLLDLDGGNCKYLIEYWYTECDEGHKTQITSIYKLYGGESCTFTNTTLRKEAYSKLWVDNPMDFEDLDYEIVNEEFACYEVAFFDPYDPIELIVPESFAIDINLEGIDYELTPGGDYVFEITEYITACTGSVCCKAHYNITLMGTKITSIELYYPSPLIQPECPNPPGNCDPGCNALKFNWYAPPFNFMTIDNKPGEKENLSIIPNPNDGEFRIFYKSEIFGNITFEIVNSLGIVVYSEQIIKKELIFESKFILSNNPIGKYYFRMKFGNEIITTGSFSLIK